MGTGNVMHDYQEEAMASTSIDVRISQAYLELARSYESGIARSVVSDVSQPDALNQANRATTTFAFAALSTVFSYAAIEAFVNHELFHIWEHAREAHDIIETIQRSDPSRRYVALFDNFHRKYGRFFPFKALQSTDLRDLTERIKTICRAHELPLIHESDFRLWENLLRLEETRHLLIHPTPEHSAFNKVIERVFSTEPYHLYPETAASVIRFFFTSAKAQPPDYLNGNRLFAIHNIDILY